MAATALQSMRSLICAFDIIFATLSLASLYTPLFWRGWTYEKGSIIRRDLWISRFVVFATVYRLIGNVFSIANLIREPHRYTLLLKTIHAVTTTPLDISLWRVARKTWKTAVRGSAEGDAPPAEVPVVEEQQQSRVPKSREVLVARNADRDVYYHKKLGFWEACLYQFKWAIPESIIVVGMVLTSMYLAEFQRGRIAPAVLIWTLPLLAVIVALVVRRLRASDDRRTFRICTMMWAAGTIPGYIVFLAVFFVDLEDRKRHIGNWTEVWVQLAEGLCGGGG